VGSGCCTLREGRDSLDQSARFPELRDVFTAELSEKQNEVL
jgi:hypothetical protein